MEIDGGRPGFVFSGGRRFVRMSPRTFAVAMLLTFIWSVLYSGYRSGSHANEPKEVSDLFIFSH